MAADENRGSMAWRCWQIGGYRCGNITRQAFDAVRGEGHFLDSFWGGFPGTARFMRTVLIAHLFHYMHVKKRNACEVGV